MLVHLDKTKQLTVKDIKFGQPFRFAHRLEKSVFLRIFDAGINAKHKAVKIAWAEDDRSALHVGEIIEPNPDETVVVLKQNSEFHFTDEP